MESRRDFLKTVFAGAAVAAGMKLGVDHAAAGWFGGGEPKDDWINLGPLQNFNEGDRKPVKEGVRVANKKTAKDLKLVVSRKGDQVQVMSTKCTHAGCEVYLRAENEFYCPCHAAIFTAAGEPVKGPVKKPLPWFESKVENGEVLVNLGKTVAAPQ